MYQTYKMKEKIILFLKILVPILVTQLGLFSMNFIDVMMSGRAGASDIAGVAIGSSLWVPVFTGLSGILLAATPIISQSLGAKKEKEIPFTVIQGIYLSIALVVLILIIGAFSIKPILGSMGLEYEVYTIAFEYLKALSFGMIPLFVYTVIRCFMDALGETRITMFITLISLPINAFLNYIFIFGKFGFPRLGGVGAGYATAITYWCIVVLSLWISHKRQPFSKYKVFTKLYKVSISKWKEILLIGVPIGIAIFFETSIFAAVTLLMSQYDTITIAAHQVALNFASFLYMVPLSISMALTICIGFEVGGNRLADARQYSFLGISTGLGMAIITGLILFLFPEAIAQMYSKDIGVITLAQHFLFYAIFFQLSDAVGAPIQGALRGYKDVNVTLILSLISFWVIGLPSGFLLAQYTPFQAYGYWIGLSAGLTVGAILLFMRLRYMQKKLTKEIKKVANL